MAAGPFTPGGPTDLVTINPGSNTLDVLAGLGGGRFANPVAIQTPSPAQVVRVADFNGNGIPDLAVLTADGREHLPGQRQGRLLAPGHLRRRRRSHRPDRRRRQLATANPTCSSATPMATCWCSLGNGDGTFRPYRKAGQGGHRPGRGRPHRRRHPRLHLRRPGARPRLGRLQYGEPDADSPRSSATSPPACSPPAPSSWPTSTATASPT